MDAFVPTILKLSPTVQCTVQCSAEGLDFKAKLWSQAIWSQTTWFPYGQRGRIPGEWKRKKWSFFLLLNKCTYPFLVLLSRNKEEYNLEVRGRGVTLGLLQEEQWHNHQKCFGATLETSNQYNQIVAISTIRLLAQAIRLSRKQTENFP